MARDPGGMLMKRVGNRPGRAGIAIVVLAAVAGTACGSALTDDEMLRANSEAFRIDNARATGTSLAAGIDEATTDAIDAGPAAAPEAEGTSDTAASPTGSATGSAAGTASGVRSPGPAGSSTPGVARNSSPGGATSAPKPGSAAQPAAPSKPGNSVPRAPTAPTGPRSEIRLGSIGQQSGVIGTAFVPLVQAAKAWAADVNARGGLAGHPVRVIFGDDGGDPSRALALAKRMVEQEKVLALFAGQMALTLQAITPYLEQKQVPFIHNTPSAPEDDRSPMVFLATTGATAGTQWAHVAGLMKYYGDTRKVAIMYCREAQTCPQLAAGAKKYAEASGMQVVSEQQVSLAQPDFTAEVIAARNAGAEAIIPVLENASVIRLIRSAKRQGWDPIISSQMALHDERFITVGGGDVEGSVAGSEVPWATSQHPIMIDYRAAIDRYIPGGVKASLGAAAYVAGRLLEVVAAGFPPEPTSQDVLNGYWALRGETLGGLLPPITFAREGGHAATNPCVVAVIVRGGKFAENTDYMCPPGYTRPN